MMNKKKNLPKRRFKEFLNAPAWEQRKLGDLGKIATGTTPSKKEEGYYSNDGIPWITPTDINSNLISDSSTKLSDRGIQVGRVVPANTLLCTCIASIGKNALLTVLGSFNQQINSLIPSVENDAYFLLTESELWSKIMKQLAASGTMQIVNKTEFSNIETLVPKLSEQKQIGIYFRYLDSLITLHQRKLDKLKNQKQAYLSEMFPAEGERVPQRRFAEFTEDWEQRKLGDLGKIATGTTPSKKEEGYYSNDGIPWITPTDINSNLISDSSTKLSDRGIQVGRVVPANTLLCTCIASIGKNALLTVLGSFNQQINSLIPSVENDAYFLLTESELWSKIMKQLAASGTMQIVNKTEFSNIETLVPKLSEQKQIGIYFRYLDSLITLHQRKLDKLKNLKKAYLEELFA